MLDWKKLVRKRLSTQDLPHGTRDDIVAELAIHLDETYEHALSKGLTRGAAIKIALQEVGDWRVLATEIDSARCKEGPMNHRTKSFWLPVLITLLGASVSLEATQFAGLQPQLVWVGNMGVTFYWPWLASLPIFGAAGAYLTRRAAGQTSMRLAACLSPALVMLVAMFLLLPWVLAGFHLFRLMLFGLGLINWVGIPAAALLLGALPFLRGSRLTVEMKQ
ncbi:MAG TPA: permease prefix domain 1-containing protein [Candidatus Sulfotelmatobacter sp.]|nr:permease prefix domain 1-containing protein [Candidatus Sulfotelmatobacter sp.]